MPAIKHTEIRNKLATAWDESISTREPVTIDRRGHESMVLVPIGEWGGLVETVHLLRSPANALRLLAALSRLDQGKATPSSPSSSLKFKV